MASIENAKKNLLKHSFHKSLIGGSEWIIDKYDTALKDLNTIGASIHYNKFLAANGCYCEQYILSNAEFNELFK